MSSDCTWTREIQGLSQFSWLQTKLIRALNIGCWDRKFDVPGFKVAQVAHVLASAQNQKSHAPTAVKHTWSSTRVARWANYLLT
eukprot:3985558-Amphidinium_carterae.1